MILLSRDGDTFASGAIPYFYRPATEGETTNRIILRAEIEGYATEAIVDTGAPYVVVAPRVARLVGFTQASALDRGRLLIRGMRLDGSIARMSITFRAQEGESLTQEATVFVPDVEEYWGNFPSFIGLAGFLERIRFAIDPLTDTFYFGPLS
ncbi:pepsin/retropepsin-like aspartic protease family protein [Aerosakkonema funiforme]|uniref:hypothetical protein n=1 Tax=Aerosakkonema funiforme TaxID=1246630 RepID=UPI001F549B04|nr:hypothetical protein [Aerosakkonema funiforme]